jgi:MFS family permease
LLNLFLHLQDIGMGPRGAAFGLSAVFVTGLVGKVLVGAAAERWGTYPVWLSQQALLLAGALTVALAGPVIAIPGLVLLGLGWAGCYVLTQVVISDVFAGANLGKIAGAFIVFEAISSGSGVWIAAALFDAYGSYRFAFQLCCGLVLISIAATLLFRRSVTTATAR